MRWRLAVGWLLMLCAVVAVAALGGPVLGDPAPATAPPTLKDALDKALKDKALASATVGMRVVDCADGAVLYDHGGATPLNPASNTKLFTAAVALDTLGPAYHFTTLILGDGPIEGGTLKGNLYLKGGGDPELVYEKVWKVVKELQALGLKRVEGDVVADDSFFDGESTIVGWEVDGDDASRAYFAPLGALSFNFNTVAVVVRPGEAVGDPVQVSLETPTDYVRFDIKAKTEAPGRRVGIQVLAIPGTSPALMEVTGGLPKDAPPRRYYRAVPSPAEFALTLFTEMLAREGITVGGGKRLGKVPAEASTIHEITSSSLDIILKYMNKISSNFIAEQLLKTLGAEKSGAPGSTASGLKVVHEWLDAHGLANAGMEIHNGSGLANGTRISPRDFTALLVHVYRDPRIRWEFVSSLPIAGVDGTLRSRMRNGPAEALVRAKTGSIDGVYGVSGYAVMPDGKMAAFSVLANDLRASGGSVRRAIDAVIEALVTPVAPSVQPGAGP